MSNDRESEGVSVIKIGIIGGSGLGAMLAADPGAKRHSIDTPFGATSDSIIETSMHGVPVFFLSRHGPGHLLNPSRVPYRANIFALKQLGVTHILASGAVGSLRDEYRPRELVIVDQVIDKTIRRASTFFDESAVHVEFAEPFCPYTRQALLDAARREPALVAHDGGCYVAMEGPAFSTRAESIMHRLWGGGVIGMTAMPEAKLAREAEIGYALIALVTDYDCWRNAKPSAASPAFNPDALLAEIISNLDAASKNALALIHRTIELMSGRQEQLLASPARRALRLAIWSDKKRISEEEKRRLAPLWIQYFESA